MSKFSKKFLKKSPFKSVVGHLASGALAYKMAPTLGKLYVDTISEGDAPSVAVLGGMGALAVGKGIQALKTPGKALLGAATSPIGTVALAHGAYKLGKHLNKKRKERKARKEFEKEQKQQQKSNNNDV